MFTRAEAARLLPKVRPLLEDIKRRKAAFDRRPSELVARELRALIAEVAALGVEVKDLDIGLIDFRMRKAGREVYLCWKLGEGDRISYWHELEAGYPGRKLIED